MVTGVHDTCASDECCAEGRDQDDEGSPNFALSIKDVELGCEVEREVEEASKGDYAELVRAVHGGRRCVPLLCPEGKLLKPSCRM